MCKARGTARKSGNKETFEEKEGFRARPVSVKKIKMVINSYNGLKL